ncbi:MAG TPA: tRNA epoxyqueuosine(34) reductase QueG [Kofleriaceae bacterium]|nr:tRNA epoxyqueuosine(34) reductase QueG [Kofleriaceae bacterium]
MIEIAQLARELGFHRVAVVPIEPPRRHDLYTSWLADGRAGEMTYLATAAHIAPRADLRSLLATAQALVVVALAYHRDDPVPVGRLAGKIARYARGEDYHLVMRDKLVALAKRLADTLGGPVATRPCVDSAPIHEREWAERGGLGFIAKNTMLIAPGLGSYVVLGELLVDVPIDQLGSLAPETPPKPRCGSCRACLDACPTHAFVDAYVLDARRCISYLTIEHHGAIPRELRAQIGTWVFGCDVCQEVCPFNAGTGEPADPMLTPRTAQHALPDLVDLAAKGANQLRRFVRRTAMRRISREVLLRNVSVALGNTGDPAAIPALVSLVDHPLPLVRGHAAWALGQLGGDMATAALHAQRAREHDRYVIDEIDAALT